MSVYIAVVLSEDRIQVAIPIKWYGRLDCNGYNKGINKHLKRRVFFSPFGDHVEPDFALPISDFYQPDANACYEVYFLRACDTKQECIEFLNNRRVLYPPIYNERRLHEHIPDPRTSNENLDTENAVDQNAEAVNQNTAALDQVLENANAVPQNLAAPVEQNNNVPPNDDDDGVHVGEEMFDQLPENVNIGQAYDNANENVLQFDIHEEEEEEIINGAQLNVVRVKREIKFEVAERLLEANQREPIVDLCFSDDSEGEIEEVAVQPVRDEAQLNAFQVKLEIKAEAAERLLEANQREPIVDLCSIDDPEEAAAFAAIGVNNEVDDSDDEISELFDVLPQNHPIPIPVKFDFDSNDILSGNILFEINVSLIFVAINI